MRSIWKGAISFGMVNIPVKLYPATQQSQLKLQTVDKRDSGKIRYKRINENTGKEVPSEDITKAFILRGNVMRSTDSDFRFQQLEEEKEDHPEKDIRIENGAKDHNKNEIIFLSGSDIKKALPEKSRTIEVNHFVEEKEIDPVYFENSYYIEPENSGEKAYALLREALKKSGKVGVGQFILRTTATLALIKPLDEVLVLCRIRFAEEIRSTTDLILPSKTLVRSNELKMALTLIDQYSGPFDIKKYKDEYTKELLKTIKEKATGKEAKVRRMKIVESDDLIRQLKASLSRNRAS